MLIKGKVWKYGDDINTDVLFPGKYTYTVTDSKEMAKIALEDLDPEFAANVQKGDVIVGGANFGCGSSREQAASCLLYAGVGAVVAKTFARIFFRNCINFGLPALTSAEAVDALEHGESIEIDTEKGEIRCKAGVFSFPPLPEEVVGIFDAGGLIPYTKKQLGIE
ncbi:MAG: 3-isopropylmalate dehydratase small subunit [Candidatus Marinimicrobia bacterium]|nr:3-isopropylmalate dehydratase small subunit [bacterium]MCG2716615.1 3-isopropylmalate dehydratase small subunit [Candidatus Neomarinimicrobiota bacterium]